MAELLGLSRVSDVLESTPNTYILFDAQALASLSISMIRIALNAQLPLDQSHLLLGDPHPLGDGSKPSQDFIGLPCLWTGVAGDRDSCARVGAEFVDREEGDEVGGEKGRIWPPIWSVTHGKRV